MRSSIYGNLSSLLHCKPWRVSRPAFLLQQSAEGGKYTHSAAERSETTAARQPEGRGRRAELIRNLHSAFACRLLEQFKSALFLLLLSPFHRAALADGAPVSTHFSYNAPNATSVGLAGEFNSWQPAAMTKGADGTWTADVPISPGEYGYKFLVDGNDWEQDPNNAARKTVDGVENSSITVTGTMAAPAPSAAAPAASAAPSITGAGAAAPASGNGALFTYSNPTAGSVFLAGQFNGWNTSATPMQKDASGTWSVRVPLSPGSYQYKLFVDGAWMLDPGNSQQADDGTGNQNSLKVVGSDSSAPAAAPSASPSTSP